ncbi:hypothetical protein [uncultured Legionella sp.]|uniref:hypothetical protein n=1 Tax=uncultured Legionella sp. TaxID=210934 RepID=UPI00260A2330|nr:hypothetical protein [uncultured Legionella sp.]
MPTIDLTRLDLAVPTINFQHGPQLVTRPITDHSPIIQNTRWGAVATLNILHPGSPLAPPAQIDGITALPVNGKVQMEAMAKYIFKIFQQGIGLLALQEVPALKTENFKFLKEKLENSVASSNIIKINALEKQWSKTGIHRFGTSVLYNPALFEITKLRQSDLQDRIAIYEVEAANGELLPVANIHGDFKNQTATAQYIEQFDGIVLGDTNITFSSIKASTSTNIIRTIERPRIEIEGVGRLMNTVDCIQDNYSKKFDPGFTPNVLAVTF